jgi:hypothetical protein
MHDISPGDSIANKERRHRGGCTKLDPGHLPGLHPHTHIVRACDCLLRTHNLGLARSSAQISRVQFDDDNDGKRQPSK